MSPQPNKRPLDGVRVIDFSMHMAGPFCTRALADLGADVVKVEPPGGDNMRTMPPLREGASSYFGHVNVGKRSVVLDLKLEDQKALALDLLRDADVLVENGRPGAMKGLGLDYDTVGRMNPRLIYCSISGFGQYGPGAQRPAYAMTIHAASGMDLAHMHYQEGQDRPPNVGIFTADFLAGVYAQSAVLAALYDRERTCRGQAIDLSLMDCILSMLPYEVQESQFPSPKKRNTYRPLKTADGFIMLALVSQKNFEGAFAAMERKDLLDDPRYVSAAARGRNWSGLFKEIECWTATRTAAACLAAFEAAGIPATKYQTVKEALQDPQLATRGTLARVSDNVGPFAVVNQPYQLSRVDISAVGEAPALGQHTAEVLHGLAGKPGGMAVDLPCVAGTGGRPRDNGG
ncbi:MAG: CoA transferase [Pseudomonadota bacterium]